MRKDMKKHKCCEHAMKKHETKKEKKIERVMHEFKEGALHSGSKKGPIVENPKQGLAIAFSEARRMKKNKK